jgi:hypothetical protein
VSLLASAVLAGGERGLSSLELKGVVFALMQQLMKREAHVHIPRQDQQYAVEVGLRMRLMRHLIGVDGGVAALLRSRRRCWPFLPMPSPTCWFPPPRPPGPASKR